jgi:hypothetical protein
MYNNNKQIWDHCKSCQQPLEGVTQKCPNCHKKSNSDVKITSGLILSTINWDTLFSINERTHAYMLEKMQFGLENIKEGLLERLPSGTEIEIDEGNPLMLNVKIDQAVQAVNLFSWNSLGASLLCKEVGCIPGFWKGCQTLINADKKQISNSMVLKMNPETVSVLYIFQVANNLISNPGKNIDLVINKLDQLKAA